MTEDCQSNDLNARVGPVHRAIGIMRLLAGAGRRGVALTELSKISGLPHPTVHRILKQLITERVACRSDSSGLYRLGELTYELGLAAAEQHDIRRSCHPVLVRLAHEVGDTVYLVTRSGLDAVCVDKSEGPSAIGMLTLDVGSRRPLGVGAGGLAILAALADPERRRVMTELSRNARLKALIPPQEMAQNVERSRRLGFSLIRNQLTLGVSAVGCQLSGAQGQLIGAVTIAATNQRLSPSRVPLLVAQLQKAVQTIERIDRNTCRSHDAS